jgi:predicted small metal-binding protein
LPLFLDVHSLQKFNEDTLKKLQESPRDEYGVKHIDIFYNPAADLCFCIVDAPDIDAVEKHHAKLGVKCNWITQVKSIAENG